MNRYELINLLKLAEKFVYDPEEKIIFTGHSLRDIISHLRSEVEISGKPVDEIIALWAENADRFRGLMVKSAKKSKVTVEIKGRSAVVVREDDAVKAASKCPKGPDYHYPGPVKLSVEQKKELKAGLKNKA